VAEDLAPADVAAVGHHRADRGQRDEVADLHVERPAPHLGRLPAADVDHHALDALGLGVLAQVGHPGNHDPAQVLADPLHRLDRHAEDRHRLAERGRLVVERRELPEPGQQDLHGNTRRLGCQRAAMDGRRHGTRGIRGRRRGRQAAAGSEPKPGWLRRTIRIDSRSGCRS
jgi:hypothetical protein